jgi:hypothetical protein
MMTGAVVSCDLCGSSQVVKAGSNSMGEQVYQCTNHAHGRHRFALKQNILKTETDVSLDARVCAILEKAKNMTEASTISKVDAGKTSNLIEYAWALKKKNKKENTIQLRVYYLE